MKIAVSVLILSLATLSQSVGYLRIYLLGVEFKMDAEYGNITKKPDNETHLGSVVIQFIRKIPRFVETKVLMSSGHVILNKTIMLCDEKSMKKAKAFFERSIGIFGAPDENISQRRHPPEIKCPLQEGILEFDSVEKSFDLPMFVPSFMATPGNYEFASSLNIITGRGASREVKSAMSNLLHFQIQQINN